MLKRYRTVKENGEVEIEIKKSRFLCSLKRITTEEEAKQFIQEKKKEHWKANHHCSAMIIGEKNQILRSSDDGEPSGTAGIPMLEVLKQKQLMNVVAVVTRYFGGTKLGTGGLIRAYTQSVAQALKEIGIVEGILQQELFIQITYPQLGKVENFLNLKDYGIKETLYTDNVTVVCLVDETNVPTVKKEIIDLLNGQVKFKEGALCYHEQQIHSDN